MKVLILAGRFGTRLSEETDLIPKPLVRIGIEPILVYIMKIYSHFGFNAFILCSKARKIKKENWSTDEIMSLTNYIKRESKIVDN